LGEQCHRKLIDALAVQNEIAHQIVEKLKLRLSSKQILRMAMQPTTNPKAYQLYLKGRHYAGRFDPVNLNKGRDCPRQAIAADPSFALAYDGLFYYQSLLIDWFEPAKEAARRVWNTHERLSSLTRTLQRRMWSWALPIWVMTLTGRRSSMNLSAPWN
jgi:hypothetical protein